MSPRKRSSLRSTPRRVYFPPSCPRRRPTVKRIRPMPPYSPPPSAKPPAPLSHGINMEDPRRALTQASVNAAKGNFDGPRQDYQIDANDQLVTSADYKSVVVAYRNGAPVMLTDVAKIVDGIENNYQAAWMNQTPAVIRNVQRQRGAKR